ncbi:hypothetical protein [Streptomyces sp. NPDC058701]|uniref:hypothetical protein n=1 Tax=Streptomyces sp. NPDC058701 TaxID=3346608 RepID=UPI003662457D
MNQNEQQPLVDEIRHVLAAGGFANLEGTDRGPIVQEEAHGVLITWQVSVHAVLSMDGRGDQLEHLVSLHDIRQVVGHALTAILERAGLLVDPSPADGLMVTRAG